MRIKSSPAELIVGSSQDIDDDLSDVEEVFIRDGKSERNRDIENKPLMPSRKKHQHKNCKTTQQLKILKKQYKRSRCHRCLVPFCYSLLLMLVLLIFSAIILTLFPVQKLKLMFHNATPKLYTALMINSNEVLDVPQKETVEQVPCQNIAASIVWSKTLTKLNSEAPLRKADLNGDFLEDIIVGFGVDDTISFDGNTDIPQCTLPNGNGQIDLCEGGIMALNGLNGDVLWKYWTPYAIFSLFCKFDVNDDHVNDCIIAGPGGLLQAVDGKSGKMLWEFKKFNIQSPEEIDINSIDLYTINLMRDLNSDGIPDIIGAHTDERFGIREGHIRLISGKNGKIIRSIPAPFKEEIFVPVQLMTLKDGDETALILTGGQNTAGGVYKIRLDSLKNFRDDNDFVTVQRSSSGFLVPAVLTDLNGDSIVDFVVSSFNSTVYAFNGASNNLLWSFNFPSSESVSSIVPGFYNHDNVTDFMIKYSTGPGFPVYYYSQTTILDGLTGKSFLDSKITDSGGAHSLLGGISISQTYGGDLFLHFQSHCRDNVNAKDPYKFVPDSDIIQQSRADICMLRYNTSTVLKLNAISRHLEPPGTVIFVSDNIPLQLNQSEKSTSTSSSINNVKQPLKHPKMRLKLAQNRYQPQAQPPIEVNKKQSNLNEQSMRPRQQQQQQIRVDDPKDDANEMTQIVAGESQKQKAIKLREKQLSQDLAVHRLKLKQNGEKIVNDFEDGVSGNNFNDIMNKISMMDLPREYKEDMMDINQINDGLDKPDYDIYYDQAQQKYIPRRWNGNNRGIRSETDFGTPSTYETILHDLEKSTRKQDQDSQTVKKVLDDSDVKTQPMMEARPETLWDIEIEKENNENQKNQNKKKRRRREAINNENILPSIASTGILIESLNKTNNNTLDFIFVLNVRESEAFPPLLTQDDVNCVEGKMAALANFPSDVIDWQKGFLNECLKSRLSATFNQKLQESTHFPAYETQISIVRISISCTCNELNEKREVCSTFKNIKDQKWPEYMGVELDGSYNALN